jgi:phage tail protein X
MRSPELPRDTCSILLWVLLCSSLARTLFLRDQGSFSNHSVQPRRFRHPSIRSRTATIITRSISLTFQGGRVSTQVRGLNHGHRMTQAVLHANPGSAAHSPFLRAASSTTAPPTSARWPPSPTLGTCAAPAADIRAATAVISHRTLRRFHQQPAHKERELRACECGDAAKFRKTLFLSIPIENSPLYRSKIPHP